MARRVRAASWIVASAMLGLVAGGMCTTLSIGASCAGAATMAAGVSALLLVLPSAPWAPAGVLLAIGPFQGLLIQRFGFVANMVTWLPIGVFLVWRYSLRAGGRTLASHSPTFRTATAFVASLGMAAVGGALDGKLDDAIVDLGQKITLMMLVALSVYGLRDAKGMSALAWSLIGGVALFYALSMMDLYVAKGALGTGLVEASTAEVGATEGSRRLIGIGDSMGSNRLAFWGVLPATLAVALARTRRRRVSRMVTYAVAGLLIGGIFASGSRSGILGLGVALMFIVVLRPAPANEGRARTRKRGVLVAVSAIGGAWALGAVGFERMFGNVWDELYLRVVSWKFGLGLFWTNPLTGVGVQGFAERFQGSELALLFPSSADAHSAWIEVMAVRGAVSGVLFIALMYLTSRALRTAKVSLGEPIGGEGRMIAFATYGGFVGMVVILFANSYHYDRVIWFAVAVAVWAEGRRMLPSPLIGPRGKRGGSVVSQRLGSRAS